MKLICSFVIFVSLLYSQVMQEKIWKEDLQFLNFLEQNNIPTSVFYNLDSSDQKLTEDIMAGTKYYILKDDNNTQIKQVLIPVGQEIQIHLYLDNNNTFKVTITPYIYQKQTKSIEININYSASKDIYRQTKNEELVKAFIGMQYNKIDLTRLRKNDKIRLYYTQKTKLSKIIDVTLHAIEVKSNKKSKYIIDFNDKYYNDKAKAFSSGYYLITPLKYRRISSKFTYKRWHPILKRYRAHLGIDYAAKTGTPIWATAKGKIILKRRKGGYGKCIEIRHENGYKSIYAHMSGYANVKVGQRVKKHQIIGYVGSTGRSTGPHLHFGLYKWGKAVNPAKSIKIVKYMTKRNKIKFKKYLKKIKKLFQQQKIPNYLYEDFNLSSTI